jgi:hypothetical protein
MIQFDKPENLNGFELVAELETKGIKVIEPLVIDGNGDFWIDINSKDQVKAKAVVAAHNGTVAPVDNTTQKAELLAKLGITEDEAKLLLG